MGKHIVSMMLAALIGLGASVQEIREKEPVKPVFSNKSISGFSYEKVPKAVKEKISGVSYRSNPNIKIQDLRYVKVKYYGYDGKIRSGLPPSFGNVILNLLQRGYGSIDHGSALLYLLHILRDQTGHGFSHASQIKSLTKL